MNRSATAMAVLGLAVVSLVLAWRLFPTSVPLYDGLLLPPPPYRYLNPPAGVAHTNSKPLSARQTFDIVGGQSGASFVGTGESQPQARLIIDDAGLKVPKGAKSFTLSIGPIPLPRVKPDGPVDGNVYLLMASGNNGAPLSLAKPATVVLRGTGQKGKPIIEELLSNRWQHITTTAAGTQDTYYGNITALGPVVLVFAGKGSSGSSNGWLIYAAMGLFVLVVLVAGLLLIRFSRSRGGLPQS